MSDPVPGGEIQAEIPAGEILPWTDRDAWLGVGLLVLVVIAGAVAVLFMRSSGIFDTVGLPALELSYLIPVIVILGYRKANWSALGFRKFSGQAMGFGCGLLIGAYIIIIIHNTILLWLGIQTQGDEVKELMSALKSPVGFILGGVITAPFVEEIFFRGFLFQGLRRRHGWNKAAIYSSIVFAVLHLDLVALIPTFVLGYVLSWICHKANSLWPGVILHFLVNFITICSILVTLQLGNLQK